MAAYASGPIQEAQVMKEFIVVEWPGKQRVISLLAMSC